MAGRRWVFLLTMGLIICASMVLLSGFWEDLQTSFFVIAMSSSQVASITTPTSTPTPVPVETPTNSYLGYTTHTFTEEGETLTYYLYVPKVSHLAQKYPLVLLLQGGGERSKSSNTAIQNEELLLSSPYASVWSQDYNALGNPQIQRNWPCFVVIPQIALSQQWVNVPIDGGSYTQPAQPSTPLLLTRELLDALQHKYTSIDATRLYITGLSNGGYGTWDAIERWPDYFAAAAPIAGAGDPSKAAVLRNLPIWAFHGSVDPVVPVTGSREIIEAIQNAGGHPKYTEFANQGHGVWPYVYALNTSPLRVADFFPWLFSQQRKIS